MHLAGEKCHSISGLIKLYIGIEVYIIYLPFVSWL